ncbi:hypothetical protein [Comamonas sp. GB3 AK4-5]|uniref:hypothetical protein n=1 Tax=Comamonas sp. GB3 AK4-5 TaxID=3231487 RepID=UPI00351F3F16
MTSNNNLSDDENGSDKYNPSLSIPKIIQLIEENQKNNERDKRIQLAVDKNNNKYRAEYQKRERELEETFAKKEEQLNEREKINANERDDLQKRIKEHENYISQQRKQIDLEIKSFNTEKADHLANYHRRMETIESERVKNKALLDESIKKMEAESAQSKKELNEKIFRSSQTYITETLKALKSKEIKYQIFSMICSSLGGIALAAALAYFIDLAYKSAPIIPEKMTWEIVIFLTLKGFISISLLAGFSRYAYILSNTYLKEALKISDRMHAISFGKFYLDSYGSTHDWEQVKQVFENWNINNTSTTPSTKVDDIDLVSLDKATTIIERISKTISSMSGKADKS